MNEIPSVFADIPAHLSAAAILAVPAGGSFRVETTTVDGRGRAMLACAVCSWYGYHVSSAVGGRVGDLFGAADVARLTDAAAAHRCPPAVTRAAVAARLVAPGLVPGERGGPVLLLDETVNVRGLDQQIAGVGGQGIAVPGQSANRGTGNEAVSAGTPSPETPALKDTLAAIDRVHGIRSRLETEAATAGPRTAQFLRGPVDDELQLLEYMLGQERDRASAEPS